MLTSALDRLEANAKRLGRREAVRMDGASLTYAALHRASNKMANMLNRLGVQKGQRVGIYMDKSLDFIVSIFGVLKSGAAYVPLDCNSPVEATKYFLLDSDVTAIITTEPNLSTIMQISREIGLPNNILLVGKKAKSCQIENIAGSQIIQPGKIARQSGDRLMKDTFDSEGIATILYTSGTTGRPKGAMISRRNIETFIEWGIRSFSICEHDKVISHAPLHFDLSLFDIFTTIAAGACVVLVPSTKSGNPRYLAHLVSEESITIWQSVPSALILMAEYGNLHAYSYDSLRVVLFAGERMAVKYLRKLMDAFYDASFYNVYGCTETNDTFIYEVKRNGIVDPLPIGKPLPYVDFMIVDEERRPVATGDKGELLVSAPTTMMGYWRKKDDTDICLFRIQSESGIQKTYFSTKDIVSIGEDGNMMLHGRTDHIVKSNGYRINLSEIEACLLSHKQILDAVAIPSEDEFVGNMIRAVVVTGCDNDLSAVDLKIYCAEQMPRHMIPHVLQIVRQGLPRTSSGKTDRQLLMQSIASLQNISKVHSNEEQIVQ